MHADAGSGKAADTAAAAKGAKRAAEQPDAGPVKAAAGSSAKEQPADVEIEAGEVDAKKGNLLRPEAPEFKPAKDGAAASGAAAAASSKRKETEQPSHAQVAYS